MSHSTDGADRRRTSATDAPGLTPALDFGGIASRVASAAHREGLAEVAWTVAETLHRRATARRDGRGAGPRRLGRR